MKPWYGGINNHEDLKDCTPESFKCLVRYGFYGVVGSGPVW